MKTYPNQHCLRFKKEKLTPGEFFSLRNDSAFAAMKDLTYSTFKVYLYLCTLAPVGIWYLSQLDVAEQTGIAVSTYHKSTKELKDKGYLVKEAGGSYTFHKEKNRPTVI